MSLLEATMRRTLRSPAILLATALLLAAPGAARAQRTAGRAAPAPSSGVLLGVAGQGTFWIAPDGRGKVRVLRRLDEIVVPRAGGFWSVRVTSLALDSGIADSTAAGPAPGDSLAAPGDTLADGAAADSLETDTAEVALHPADSADACADEEECAADGWFALAIVATPLGAPDPDPVVALDPAALDALRRADGDTEMEITFVSPDWVAWTEHTEAAEPVVVQRYDAGTAALDSVAARPFLVASPARGSIFAFDGATLARHLRECAPRYARAGGGADPADDIAAWPVRSPYVARAGGRWRIFERFAAGGESSRGVVRDCPVSDPLPTSVVAHDRLVPSWREIRRQVPEAVDAVASPSGDLVVVLSDEWIHVHAPRGSLLGAPVAAIRLSFPRIVMAEWATEAQAARWTRELAPFMEPVTR